MEVQELLAAYAGGKRDFAKANLREANLRGADLREANLREANLWGANLWGADLREADLRGARYGVLDVLRAYWYDLTEDLCLELMRHDAELLPDPSAMEAWAEGGQSCPFATHYRGFFFEECRALWQPGPPQLRGWALWEVLATHAKIKI